MTKLYDRIFIVLLTFVFLYFEIGSYFVVWAGLNSSCSPGWVWTQSSCLYILSTGIIGVPPWLVTFLKTKSCFFFYSWIKTYYTPAIFCIKDTDQVEFYMSFLFINTSVDSEWPHCDPNRNESKRPFLILLINGQLLMHSLPSRNVSEEILFYYLWTKSILPWR